VAAYRRGAEVRVAARINQARASCDSVSGGKSGSEKRRGLGKNKRKAERVCGDNTRGEGTRDTEENVLTL
jgi:hypothetical protein